MSIYVILVIGYFSVDISLKRAAQYMLYILANSWQQCFLAVKTTR